MYIRSTIGGLLILIVDCGKLNVKPFDLIQLRMEQLVTI